MQENGKLRAWTTFHSWSASMWETSLAKLSGRNSVSHGDGHVATPVLVAWTQV